MVFKKLLSNNNGATLIYILAAFMIISFIGVTMIKQSHHEMKSSSDFSSMTTAEQAARSGLEATKQYLERDSIATRTLLNSFIRNRNTIWILGDTSNTVQINGRLGFRTKLMNFAFDTTNYTSDFKITVRSEGFGRGNSKNTVISVLDISGFQWDNTSTVAPSYVPVNAVQLDNGNFEFNCVFIVNGDASCKNKMTMNNGPADFNGRLRIDSMPDGTISQTIFNVDVTIDSNAYFAGPVDLSPSLATFNKNVGFEGLVKSDSGHQIFNGDSVFWNGGYIASDDKKVNASSSKVFAYDSPNAYRTHSTPSYTGIDIFASNTGPSSLFPSKLNIPSALGIPDTADPSIFFNTGIIDKIYKTETTERWSNKITGDTLNAWYSDAEATNMLWEGFLVVKFGGSPSSSYYPFDSSGNEFNRKVILLMETTKAELQYFYKSQPDSAITAVYIKNYNSLNPIFTNIRNFRGFVYVNNSTSKVVFNTNNNPLNRLHLDGSIYYSGNSLSKFDGDTIEVTFDGDVINKLAVTNIFTDTSSVVTPVTIDSLLNNGPVGTTMLGLLN